MECPANMGTIDNPTTWACDTEDKENTADNSDTKVRRRTAAAHAQEEKQRRDETTEAYEALRESVPACQTKDPSIELCNAQVDYILQLQQQAKEDDATVISLRKQLLTLKLINTHYETMLQQQPQQHDQNQQSQEEEVVRLSPDVKFQVFKAIMDELFISFDKLPMENVPELVGAVIPWLEEHCKPSDIRKVVDRVLADMKSTHGAPSIGEGQLP